MSSKYQNIFACGDYKIPYRYHKGVYEVNYRRGGVHIYAAASTFEAMKNKFFQKLMTGDFDSINTTTAPKQTTQPKPKLTESKPKENKSCEVLFTRYVDEWLAAKRFTVKPSTFKEYTRIADVNFKKDFAGVPISEMTRSRIQEYLFSYVNQEKHRTAEKLALAFSCIFDLAVEDKVVASNPMNKIKLPYAERKKGSAFTLEEEAKLVQLCMRNLKSDWAHAYLVLVYFGLRKSELPTVEVSDDQLTCISSKTRLGRKDIVRTIPFTPVFKRVLPYVDFEKAKRVNPNTLPNALKKHFPEHHIHELRYTFITRCKECGVSGEVVMLWDGHTYDKSVFTSAVDRGYTDYSQEFLLKEAQKVNYELPKIPAN